MIKVSIEHLGAPTLSGDSMRVLQLLGSRNLNFADLAQALERDKKMATAMLRYANSPLYRRGKSIDNVREALNLLGVTNVRLAVLSNSLKKFTVNCRNEACNYLNQYCMAVATLTRQFAAVSGIGQDEEMEITAMMSAMESLVLASNFPDEYAALFAEAQTGESSLKSLERSYFILSEEKFAAWLARHLRLTPLMAQVLVTLKLGTPIRELKSSVEIYCAMIRLAQTVIQEHALEGYNIKVNDLTQPRQELQALFQLSDATIAAIFGNCNQILDAIHT